jgi:alpha-galactosidase/6-phospho-beta-glucosidase family protein
MVNYNNPTDFSLSFANEFYLGQKTIGLFDSFWQQEYARKRIGKRLEANYFWDLLSINALSFRNKMLIDGLEWILQKIDGYSAQSDSSTKTWLILEQGPTDDDVTATTFSNIIGIINPVVE